MGVIGRGFKGIAPYPAFHCKGTAKLKERSFLSVDIRIFEYIIFGRTSRNITMFASMGVIQYRDARESLSGQLLESGYQGYEYINRDAGMIIVF